MLTLFNERVKYYLSYQNRIECDGLCFTLMLLFDNNMIAVDSSINDLPEIMANQPEEKTNDQFWFNCRTEEGIDKRIEILNKCIELTKPKNKITN